MVIHMLSKLSIVMVITGLLSVAPWLKAAEVVARGPDQFDRLLIDPQGKYAAYVGKDGIGLYVLDLKSRDIHLAAKGQVSNSFFWAPDHTRLFYRELVQQDELVSRIGAFDAYLKKSVTLETLTKQSGPLTLDPRDYRMQFLTPDGLKTRRLDLPDARFAKWQIKNLKSGGKWLATQKSILWLTMGGTVMTPLKDDGSGIDSFAIAPDGQHIAWATKNGFVYTSYLGRSPQKIGRGADPQWHPKKPNLIYASAQEVGDTIVSYDIRISDGVSRGRLLTRTQFSNERWPQWLPDGRRIAFTIQNTTDLYVMDGPK